MISSFHSDSGGSRELHRSKKSYGAYQYRFDRKDDMSVKLTTAIECAIVTCRSCIASIVINRKHSNIRKMIVSTIFLLGIVQFQSSSSSLSSSPISFRRLLCVNDCSEGDVTPYIDTTDQDASSPQQMQELLASIDAPKIPGRMSTPSHIILCTEFLKRKKMHEDGQVIPNDFHVEEDDAVCRDWSTPHISLMEMVSNNIISYVASKYRVSYTHNCQRDNSPDPDGTTDGHDWTTIQEMFPPSGLVLDNGVVNEQQIEDRCRDCISLFNEQQKSHEELQDFDPEDPNPPWFDPHQTHHCILYPRSLRPLVNDQMETDMVALTEQRAMAQQAPFSKIVDTLKDRLRLSAMEYKLEHGDPPLSGRELDSKSFNLSRSLGSFLGFQKDGEHFFKDEPAPPPGSNIEEQNGAIIYLDEGSYALSNTTYAKYIPTTVSTIDILTGPMCIDVQLTNGQSCREHADEIQIYMTKMYPDSEVRQHVGTSTAMAYSRLILAKYIVCPPGTTSCLLPALAKEENTFAAVAESPERENTFQYFDFVRSNGAQMQVAHIPHDHAEGLPESAKRVFTLDGSGTRSSNTGNDASKPDVSTTITPTTTTLTSDTSTDVTDTSLSSAEEMDGPSPEPRTTDGSGLSIDSFLNSHDYRDGCVELRGKLGSWELDYSYQDLKHDEASSLLRGQSNVDVTESRFQDESGNTDSIEGRFGAWKEDVNPECALDMLNLNGLCEIVRSMGLGVIQFVGDQYTEEQVKSFWSLIGLEDRDDPDDIGKVPLQDGQDLHQYRKTAHCPAQQISFDIVFTPNEYLVQNVEVPVYIENTPETRYVPVPAPSSPQHITNNYFYDNSQTTHSSTTSTTNEESRYTENFSRTSNSDTSGANWYNQPYGVNGGYGGYSGYGGWGGFGGWGYGGGMAMGMPMMPMYSAACCCVPFQQQYQSFGGIPGPDAGEAKGIVGPGGGGTTPSARQVIVAGHTPNTSYDSFVNGIDEFSQGITDYGKSDDVVILRTGVDGNLPDPGRRRMKEAGSMTAQELNRANKYMIKAVDEFRRRTKQMDVLGTDPSKSGLPSIHVLDVSRMSSSHPHAKDIHHGRRNERVAPLYDHWNHLLYSNLRDLAAAEERRKVFKNMREIKSAPEGSPYHNGVESFPDPL